MIHMILGQDELDTYVGNLSVGKIYVGKISMKVTYLNYLDFAQQTISVTTLMSKYHFLKILGKKEALLM